jgi:peptide/nickel transport system substrate-binding protein
MDRADIANSFTGPTVFGYNPDIEYIEYNPDLAKELLAEAGYPDGFSTTLWSNGDIRNRKAQVIQSNLRDIGITAEIELLEWAAYLERTAAGEQYMHLLGWANLTGDADPGMFPLFHTESIGAGNRAHYSNPRVDELLNLGRFETDDSKRVGYYHEVQEILREDMPVVPLNILPMEFAIRADLLGSELHPGSMHRYHNLHY